MNARYVLSLALVAGAVDSAFAQANPADAEFKRGKELMAQGKLAEACAAFDKSQALEPSVSVLLNQANCREKNGQLATARELFLRASMQTDRASDAKNIALHNTAVDRAAKLADRVSSVTIDVPEASRAVGLVVTRNGVVVAPVTWNTPVLLDGGSYAIVASAPDHAGWTATVTLANEQDRKTITVPPLTPTDGPEKPTATQSTESVSTSEDAAPLSTPDAEPRPTARRSLRLPLIVGAGGLALIGTSIGFFVSAGSTYDDAQLEGNDQRQTDLWHSANNKRYVAEAAGIAGVAAIGVAVYLFIRSGRGEEPRVQASVGNGQAGLLVRGSF